MSDPLKDMCLLEELEASHKLIVAGLGELQEINMDNDFYHLPHQLLASGLERLMKCYICLVYEAQHTTYPTFGFVKSLGHDLTTLLSTIASDYYKDNGNSMLQAEHAFISSDSMLLQIVHILSEFGKFARYYNLDVVTGNQNLPIDPKGEWEKLEKGIEDIAPFLGSDNFEALYRDYYPRVHKQIVAKLERLIRSIAFQFTMGKHGGKLLQYSIVYSSFRNLRDDQLGTIDYRRSVKLVRKDEKNWIRRTQQELASSKWPNRRLLRSEFGGVWPFRADEVFLECRDSSLCVININGYDFALNGLAAGHLKLPFPHDAGEAILGKSVGPFIEMARELGTKKQDRKSSSAIRILTCVLLLVAASWMAYKWL